MSEPIVPATQPILPPAIAIFKKEDTIAKFRELLGARTPQFLTTVMSIVSNSALKDASPASIYNAAITAATLNLPVNPNLGQAYIIPYKNKSGVQEAQFQIGYKGLIQLAMRSGEFKTIAATPVYEGQLIEENPLTGYVFDRKAKKSDDIIGYVAYFSLLNGFEKTMYMTKEEAEKHGKKYSQTYQKYGSGLWKDQFDTMAVKTVLKSLISKFAPMSIEMQKAVILDQGVVKDVDTEEVDYIDNEQTAIGATNTIDPELLADWERQLEACITREEIRALRNQNKPTDQAVLSLFDRYESHFDNETGV